LFSAEALDVIDKIAVRKKGPGLELEERRERDVELWKQWKESDESKKYLRPLLNQFRGLIRSRSNSWARRADLPPAAVHAEFNKQFLHALRTFDPDKGNLGTWVGNTLKKSYRWVSRAQNLTTTQEGRYYQFRNFDAAKSSLDEQLGRPPTVQELSEQLGWSEPEVMRMEGEKRKSLHASGFEFDPTVMMPSRENEIRRMIQVELTPAERKVWELTTGESGGRPMTPGQIATRTGFSPSKVSRLRNAIAKKLEKYRM